jgi:DNA-directed RNA polymerase subunit A'
MFITPKRKKEVIKPSIRRKSPPRGSLKGNELRYKRKKVAHYDTPITTTDDVTETHEIKYEEDGVEEPIEKGSIDHIHFSFMDEQEVEKFSVVKVTETKLGGPNSLYDCKMGPSSKNEICETCEGNWEECPGHFGHIELHTHFPHPLRSKSVLEYLTLFCKDCQRLVVSEDIITILNFDKYKGEARYNKILSYVENNVSVCFCCKSSIPTYTFFDDKYMMVEGKDKKYPLHYETIYKIFSEIRNCDVELLGLDPKYVHPMKLIIKNLLVLPPCARPFIKLDDGDASHDDLTHKYNDIIKTNNKLEETINEKSKLDVIDNLMFHLKTLMDNNKGKARETQGKRPIKCIKQRISSKQGRIRQNIQGKRVNYCARTVIGGDANCMVDELIIPPTVAKKLTYPVRVTKLNIDKCNKLLEDGKVNIIIQDGVHKNAKYAMWTEGFKFKKGDILLRNGDRIDVSQMASMKHFGDYERIKVLPNDKVIRNGETINNIPIPKRKDFTLKIGDTIERQLQNGDLVVFNRQPTLWKGSMRAKRVKILPGKTFRFSLASTSAYNADSGSIEPVIVVVCKR